VALKLQKTINGKNSKKMLKNANTMKKTQSKKQKSSHRRNEHNGTAPRATETSTALVGSKERVGSKGKVRSKDRKEDISQIAHHFQLIEILSIQSPQFSCPAIHFSTS
jgi:hypothetical protein